MAGKASPRKSKFTLSPEQRDERRQEATQRLHEQVEKILSGDDYKRYLETARKFHSYSFSNILLMLAQKPEASRVASFNKWKELGRHVKAGEKALVICVPMGGKGSTARGATQDESRESEPTAAASESPTKHPRVFFGYKGAVFDVSQTEGEPLPEPPAPKILDAVDDEADIFFKLRACETYAREIGFSFRVDEVPGQSNGYADFDALEIVIKAGNPKLQQLKTAVHELAHARYHNEKERLARAGEDARLTAQSAELEAETTAFLVCNEWGIDSSDYSFPYLAAWASNKEALIPAVDRARKMSVEIVQRLDWHISANEEDYHFRGQQVEESALLKCSGAETGADVPRPHEAAPPPVQFEGPDEEELAALLSPLAATRVRDEAEVSLVTRPVAIPAGAVSIFDL